MAIKKTITNEIGIVSTYFRIADISQNFINAEPELVVYLYGYADGEYRELEKSSTDYDKQYLNHTERIYLPLDDDKGYSRSDIYSRLKSEIPKFEGAEDLLE